MGFLWEIQRDTVSLSSPAQDKDGKSEKVRGGPHFGFSHSH
ncbi:hypothetical protein VULLAG_LOCUS339 [Vulpes lagopus]